MSTYNVCSLLDSGKGSLRNAIHKANKDTSSTITFSVSGTIRLFSSLPKIMKTTIIDGTTSPKYSNSNIPKPSIIIDCDNSEGLILTKHADNSKLIALEIKNASNNGVTLYASNVVIDRCKISKNQEHGILIECP